MRLLRVHDIQLIEPPPDAIPPYAILSHTWAKDEVSFVDMEGNSQLCRAKAGWYKIEAACKQASQDDLEFLWVDTCCIDKRSSAELSEAINSMFEWYRCARICYAYLADVDTLDSEHRRQFNSSRWFTRGWTLQELLAPPDVTFYNRTWQDLGTKTDLAEKISSITGIPPTILYATAEIFEQSVAQRMSWASRRETTRVEDIAYCLLGIFDVNMPLIYGEGEKAFMRLQEEIIKNHDDHSIFAWTTPIESDVENIESDRLTDKVYGLLADCPGRFELSGNVVDFRDWSRPTIPFAITNAGLSIELPIFRFRDDIHFAFLNCSYKGDVSGTQVYIKLQRMSDAASQFVRTGSYDGELAHLIDEKTALRDAPPKRIFVRQKPAQPRALDTAETRELVVRREIGTAFLLASSLDFRSAIHVYDWGQPEQRFQIQLKPGQIVATFLIRKRKSTTHILITIGTGNKSSKLFFKADVCRPASLPVPTPPAKGWNVFSQKGSSQRIVNELKPDILQPSNWLCPWSINQRSEPQGMHAQLRENWSPERPLPGEFEIDSQSYRIRLAPDASSINAILKQNLVLQMWRSREMRSGRSLSGLSQDSDATLLA